MPAERRRIELIEGMSATLNEVVTINISHLIQSVGLEKADQLSGPMSETIEAIARERNGPSTNRRMTYRRNGMVEVDRLETLEALKEARGKAEKAKIDIARNKLSPPSN